jgi:hypothetical protein
MVYSSRLAWTCSLWYWQRCSVECFVLQRLVRMWIFCYQSLYKCLGTLVMRCHFLVHYSLFIHTVAGRNVFAYLSVCCLISSASREWRNTDEVCPVRERTFCRSLLLFVNCMGRESGWHCACGGGAVECGTGGLARTDRRLYHSFPHEEGEEFEDTQTHTPMRNCFENLEYLDY